MVAVLDEHWPRLAFVRINRSQVQTVATIHAKRKPVIPELPQHGTVAPDGGTGRSHRIRWAV